jgi:hypothetical protein
VSDTQKDMTLVIVILFLFSLTQQLPPKCYGGDEGNKIDLCMTEDHQCASLDITIEPTLIFEAFNSALLFEVFRGRVGSIPRLVFLHTELRC